MRSRHILGVVVVGFFIAVGCSDSGDDGGGGGGGGVAASGGGAADSGAKGGSGGGSAAAGTGGSGANAGVGGGGVGGGGMGATAGGGVGGNVEGGAGTAGTAATGGGTGCFPKTCQGKVYKCGDCLDNDGDGKIDDFDPDCLGPCQDNENSYYGGIPGQSGPGCKVDCYFDQDSGAGNDECCWDHRCDPLSVAPSYPPEGDSACAYIGPQETAKYSPSCSNKTCDQLFDKSKGGQAPVCEQYCGPLTPNGCDCFGCCELPAESGHFVWLGSEDSSGAGTCTPDAVMDPTKCQPCTPVAACLNTCLHCELCLGKTELPPDCFPPPPDGGIGGSSGTAGAGGTSGGGGASGTSGTGGSSGSCGGQICPLGSQPCGLACQPPCPINYYCKTGCCTQVPG